MSSKDTKETNVLAQASILMVAGIVTRIIGVLYRSPVTSIIGDEGNGYYSIAVNIYTMILLISSYSIPMAVSKVVSAKMAVHQYKIAHKVFKCALIYVLVIGGIASLITFFGASVLIPSNQPKAIPVLRILAPTIFFSGFLGVFRGYFQAHRTMIPTSLSQIVEQVANAVISIGAAVFFIHAFAGGDADKIPVFGAMGSAAGIGAGVITGLLFMDIMGFKRMASETAASLYGVFSGKYWVLINVPIALANSMSTAMIPAISGSYELKDYKKCRGHVRQAIHFTMVISIPAAIGMGALAYPIMEVLFPQKATIDLAVSILRTGCISIIFYALSTVSNGVLQGIGKVNIPLRNAAVSLVLHVVLLTPLLYFTNLNLYALVFATMFYAFLMCLLNNLSVRKYLGYHQEMKRTFMIPLLSSVIMGILCYVFYQGIYLILSGIFGSFIHLRILVFICLMISVGFAVIVYFVLVIISVFG